MSTKTSIKRIALVAVSVLGFGLLSVVPARAAVPTTATIAVPTIVRTGYTNVLTITHAATDGNDTAKGIGIAVLQQPTGSTVTLEASNAFTNNGTTAAIDFNPDIAGTYVVRAYVDQTAAGTYTPGTDTLIGANYTITVAGAPASFTFNSSSGSTGPTGEIEVDLTVLDSAGRATLLGSNFISLTITDSTATTAAVVAADSGGSGQLATLTDTDDDIFVSDTDAGSTVTVSGLLNVAGTSAQTFTYTTVALSSTEPTDATLATPTTGNFIATGSTAAARTYKASVGVTSFTATITGLEAGKAFKADIAKGNNDTVTVSIPSETPVADSSGVGTVVITATGAATTDVVTLSVDKDDATSSPAATIVITYETPAADFTDASTTPNGTTTNFTSGGAAQSIVAVVRDQYGQNIPGSYVTASYTTCATGATCPAITSVTTDAAGSATLSTTVPTVVGTYVVGVVAKTSAGVTIGSTSSITYVVTASGGPGALAISSGVNTDTSGYAVITDDDGSVPGAGAAASYLLTGTQTTGDYTTIVVNVKDDAGANKQYVTVTATPGTGVYLNSAAPSSSAMSDFNASSDLNIVTDASGNATFYAVGTIVGTSSVTFSVGSSSVSGSFFTVLHNLDKALGRTVTLSSSTVANTAGEVNQVTATVKDIWGNVVPGVSLSGSVTGAAGRFTGGGRSATIVTDSSGEAIFEVTSNSTEAGSGTLTVAGTTAAAGAGSVANMLSGDLTANLSTLTAAGTASATAAITVTAAATPAVTLTTVNTTATTAGEKADAATAAATTAGEKADAATAAATTAGEKADAATAAATTAGEKADAATAAAAEAEAEAALATAAAKAAETAAAKAGTDAVAAADAAKAEAVKATDAALEAVAAAKAAGEAAVAAAVKAALDAVAASQAAQEAAVAQAAEAYDAALEAIDASNAATDAANLAAEAADAATVAAEEARDAADAATAAIEELATQVSTLFATLRAQITTLGNTVAKIAKKVKA